MARAELPFIIYTIMGLSLGFGLGAGAYSLVSGWATTVRGGIVLDGVLVWQVLPIALASFQEQFDLSGLLRFPVNFGSFYLLNLVFGLVDVSTILGRTCCLGILGGVTLARPASFGWTALVLAVYAALQYSGGAYRSGVGGSLAGKAQDARSD